MGNMRSDWLDYRTMNCYNVTSKQSQKKKTIPYAEYNRIEYLIREDKSKLSLPFFNIPVWYLFKCLSVKY